MKLNRTPNPLDRNARNGENDNWDIIEGEIKSIGNMVDNFIDETSDAALDKVVDNAKLNWKEPVDSFSDLPSSAEEGDTRMDKSTGKVYRYDGTNWVEIQQIDAGPVNELDSRLSSQLAETEEKNPNNAQYPLIIRTYDGFNRTVHPDVVYFENGWNGYKYWMVHTPFPFDNDFWENPCIVVSNDGVQWIDAPGVTNPIDEVTEEENNSGIYLSDACLIYANDRLECVYRWYNKNTKEEKFYRQWSADGANWQGKQEVFNKSSTQLNMTLSPTIIYENGKYRMWVVDNPDKKIYYTESSDNMVSWAQLIEVPITNSGRSFEPWHIHVYKESSSLYHLTVSEYKPSGEPRSIFHATSSDGLSFNDSIEVLKTKEGASWDSGMLYRPSLTKVSGRYKLYYSARSKGGQGNWRIGLVEGNTMDTLRSSENYDENFNFEISRIVSEYVRSDEFLSRFLYLTSGSSDDNVRIKMLDRGRAGVNLVVGRNNELKVLADDEESLGDIEARKVTVNGVEIFTGSDGELRFADSSGFRDIGIRNIKLSRLTPHNFGIGITLEGKTTIQSASGQTPSLKLLHIGQSGVELRTTSSNLMEVFKDNGGAGGHMKMASLVLDGNPAKVEEGAVRYNKTTKKHQGYDGTQWHDLY